MQLLTERAEFLVECLDLPAASQVENAKWEPFQINHLNDDSTLRIEDKARQIAWSFVVAAEGVANAMLYGESTVFVSINHEEAAEKVRYAKLVYENLNIGGLPRLITDNVFGLEFDNRSRIKSLPSKQPRGKARMHIVLDEFAHVMHDDKIYAASTPIIARGGRLRIGSSPMGAGGKHWEISQQELRAYPGFTRVTTPWWKVKSFCKDGILPADAEGMTTAERVERYGNDAIRLLYENNLLDDFQQEHECIYVDETISYFTWEIIRKNQDENLRYWHIKNVDDAERVATEMKAAIAARKVEPVLVGGVDVGRKRMLTEIIFLGVVADRTPVRLMVSLDKVEFDRQETLLRHLMGRLPVVELLIDENGIGMQLAENLSANTCAQGITFTNPSKALWANELRVQLGRENVPLPVDRDLAYQIHSVKQKVTAAKNVTYDTERNEAHHADKMWALALARWAVREYMDRPTWGPGIPFRRESG